ncbi:LysR family transcriptional regulator [Pseudogulbenkiania ferrooxidans]|uniref:Transcriptional regulator, LysR family n=1 Tax=Pseudogulbenkiania ferrooxidans 2002 TaxID=279714 RepID=B9YYG9_9NEIS|nr:LysR family transcriptional regulator [Pseudogulbenkiania ferrooxidans]EEG10172.1 transcriptional regulator, LysR family [Pseudogulbenkiania ferrooxidans 2002]
MKSTTEELLAFVRVVDAGSITAAAEQLGQTTSGVSRALSRLEGKLATTLLNRTTRRLELTEEGRLFLSHARGILGAIDEAEEQMAIRRERPSGRLRVNAASPFMLHAVVPLVGAFRARYPEIELELNTSDEIIDLLEQRTDVAIRIGTLQDSSLHARPLGQFRLRLVAAPAYLERHGVPQQVDELARHALIGFSAPSSLNTWPLRRQESSGYVITPALSASSGETVRQLALAGQGIACLSDFMTGEDRRRGALVQVLAEATIETWQAIHAVYYRNTGLAARIGCFLDFLGQQLAGQGR